MNIDTAKAIEGVVKNCPFKDRVKVEVNSIEAQGKWFHKLIFKVDSLDIYFLHHIESVGKTIGNMFGEGLGVNYSKNKQELVLS